MAKKQGANRMNAGECVEIGRNRVFLGDCRDVMAGMEESSIDAIVTDPPYGLEFMGVGWDTLRENGKPRSTTEFDVLHSKEHPRKPQEQAAIRHKKNMGAYEFHKAWAEQAFRVLKPGGHLLAFGGSRTYHRLACAVEDAGFEIRDQIQWIYGSGFPKSLDVSKAIDKARGVEREVVGIAAGMGKQNPAWNGTEAGRSDNSFKPEYEVTAPATDAAKQWQGWGTALKPAHEPIVVARKPLIGTVAENVQKHGTGALNIDGCRVDGGPSAGGSRSGETALGQGSGWNVHKNKTTSIDRSMSSGRWPANVIHDGSQEVVELFPDSKGQQGDVRGTEASRTGGDGTNCYGEYGRIATPKRGDSGSAARFFYCAKASRSERGEANTHPTVKPIALMRYLCRLVTPPGGIVLDPFLGSGTTLLASHAEGFDFAGIEQNPEYVEIVLKRAAGLQEPTKLLF